MSLDPAAVFEKSAVTLVVRIAVSIIPLALTPVLIWVLAEGYLSLGGGEKDLIMALPWMVWSVFFAGAFIVASKRGQTLPMSLARGAGWATLLLVILIAVLWIAARDWLGA